VSHGGECSRCGAPLAPDAGTTNGCRYCGARERVAIDGRQIAAGLRLDLSNADALLHRLAHELSSHFAELTRVEREGGKVVGFDLTLEKDMFVIKRSPQGVVAQHKKMVRGVALKTATHPVERWIEMLTRALAEHANTSASAAQALARLNLG
jgi:hypothetical protein